MSALLQWAISLLVGAFCHWLAGKFSGACPLDPHAFLCVHWADIAGVGGSVLGAFGYPVTREAVAIATKREGLRVVTFAPGEKPEEVVLQPVPGTNLATDPQNPGGESYGG